MRYKKKIRLRLQFMLQKYSSIIIYSIKAREKQVNNAPSAHVVSAKTQVYTEVATMHTGLLYTDHPHVHTHTYTQTEAEWHLRNVSPCISEHLNM